MVSDTAYAAARLRAAVIDRSDRGRIVLTGVDRASYLQGLLTNDIAALRAGQGCYAAYLTPQGRMISDLFVYELGDAMLLSVPREQTDQVLTKLDQYIFSEDVRLGDVTETFFVTAIVGPEASRVVGELVSEGADVLEALGPDGNRRVTFEGGGAVVTRVDDTGEPGFDVYVERAHAEALARRLTAAGVVRVDAATAEAIRIEAGVPKFNRDMDQDTIPLEAGIESRALSFTKGCYVGQEVIVRVLHRGHGRVARKLVGLRIEAEQSPAPGTRVFAGDRDIGHVTSSAISPAVGQPIALAYLQRDFVAPGTPVSIDGAAGVVAPLPFVGKAAGKT